MRLGTQFTRWSKDIPQNAPFRYIAQQFRCGRAVDAIREFRDECVAFHFCFLPNRFRMNIEVQNLYLDRVRSCWAVKAVL
jgi:hypothetical protein